MLSRQRIVAAAREVADAEGLDRLTVRRVADVLGGGQASLYRHISDRGELLGLLAHDVAVSLPVGEAPGRSPQAMASYWQQAHVFLAAHPWAPRIIAGGEYVLPEAAPFAARALEGLAELGLPGHEAFRAYRAAWNLMLGHLLNAHPVGHHAARTRGDSRDGGDPGQDGAQDDFLWSLERLLQGILAATAGRPAGGRAGDTP